MASERDRRLNSLLSDLADRLAGSSAEQVLVRAEHLQVADEGLLAALCQVGLLSEAEPSGGVICDGCERLCPMPIETMRGPGTAGMPAFVLCDKRDDIGRVRVEPARLRQWRFSLEKVAVVLARQLQTDREPRATGEARVWSLGVVEINGRCADVALSACLDQAPEGAAMIVRLGDPPADAGRPTIRLDRLLTFRDELLGLDWSALEVALARRPADEQIACEIKRQGQGVVLVNHALAKQRVVARPNFDSTNDNVFSVLFEHAGRKFTLGELRTAAMEPTLADLHKLVENLNFTGPLKQLFFRVSKNAIQFERAVTYAELEALGIDPKSVH